MQELQRFCLHLFSGHGKYYIESLKKAQLLELALRSFKGHRNYKVALSLIHASRPNRAGDEPHTPSWCVCGHCRNMKRKEEELCCKKTTCLTKQNGYKHWKEIHMDYSVLTVALAKEPCYKGKFYRQEAYRQFSYWQHGNLGSGVRTPNPSCVVWNIRDCYPEEDNENYTGFEESSKLL